MICAIWGAFARDNSEGTVCYNFHPHHSFQGPRRWPGGEHWIRRLEDDLRESAVRTPDSDPVPPDLELASSLQEYDLSLMGYAKLNVFLFPALMLVNV